jgi:hypothetical protein
MATPPSRSARRELGSQDVIRLGAEQQRISGANRWGLVLVWFMRLVAVLWMIQGLMQWQVILGPNEPSFDSLAPPVAAAVIFFAVTDLVATVGLWLAAPWGGVIWVFAALCEAGVTIAIPDFFVGSTFVLGLDLLLIVAYFAITWRAAHAAER